MQSDFSPGTQYQRLPQVLAVRPGTVHPGKRDRQNQDDKGRHEQSPRVHQPRFHASPHSRTDALSAAKLTRR